MVYILAARPLIAAGRPKHYYQPIIDAAPFGAMAPDPPALDDTPVQDPQKVLEESSKIQLCAMTVMPAGRTAVGLIDNDGSQPSYLVLFDSDSSNGLKLIFSDYDREIATFERDGTMFTLQLGLGLVETITPALLEAREAEAAQLAAEEQSRRPPPNSLAEQLIAMQLSLPPDVEAPPLPIPIGDAGGSGSGRGLRVASGRGGRRVAAGIFKATYGAPPKGSGTAAGREEAGAGSLRRRTCRGRACARG